MNNKIPMTPVMLNLLNFIKKYVKKNKYCPTFQEMANGLNYKSKNSITVLINKLAKRNEVKKINGYRRNIELKN
jgi:SOS-response transcriptional repressor LexA|tara:strand:+ start:1503 stop:1724 length:222 start_codon:yes stop_codon:yes gene_type:complete